MKIGDIAPDFEADTTEGRIRFHDWIGDSWAVLFSHPKDFTPVCTTELGYMGERTPADNQTVRNVFVVGPDKKIKLILVYPMTTGRNFDEVLRVIDSLQLTAKHRVATPVNWRQGEDVIIAGSVTSDEAREIFGDWQEPKPYIRIVPAPHEAVPA